LEDYPKIEKATENKQASLLDKSSNKTRSRHRQFQDFRSVEYFNFR